jgi:WD40 repeat protein
LLARSEPELVTFLARLRGLGTPAAGWLRLLHPSLDAPGGMLRMTISGHVKALTSLASDDRHSVLSSGSADGTVKVWSWTTGGLLATLADSKLGVMGVAMSAGGDFMLSGGSDGILRLWQLAQGQPVLRLSARDRRGLRAIAMSGDARLAITATRDKELAVWDLTTGRAMRPLRGHTDSVTSVALSADGAVAVSGSDDCTLRVWNTATGSLVRTLEGHGAGINAVTLSGDGTRAMSGSADRSVRLWDVARGQCLQTLVGHASAVTAVAFSWSSQRAISGSFDAGALLWDLTNGTAICTLDGHTDAVHGVTIDRDGTLGATASADRTLKLWQLDRPGRGPVVDRHDGAVVAIAFSADGRLCASGGTDGRIKVWEVGTGVALRSIDAHTAPVRALSFSLDDTCVLSAGIEDRCWLWSVESEGRTLIPVRHLAPVDDAVYASAGRYLMTCCQDRNVHLWDVPSGARIATYGTRRLFDHLIEPSTKRGPSLTDDELDTYLPGEAVYEVGAARMDRSGRFAVLSAVRHDAAAVHGSQADRRDSPSSSRTCLLVLDIKIAGVRSVTLAEPDLVSKFDCSESGTRLLWAGADHVLRLWDLDRDELVAECRGHSAKVNAVQLCPDERHAVSCSLDRTVVAWDLQERKPIARLTLDAAPRSLAVAADGCTLAVGDVSGRLHLMRIERGD